VKHTQRWLNVGAVGAVIVAASLIVLKNTSGKANHQLVNVSYDATRELYQALNPLFVVSYQNATGVHWVIAQSHGGSSRQVRKVIDGKQPADVVTLGLSSDIEALQKRGMVAAGWADRLPNHSVPYTSTIVFVVRHGNPRGIADWPDLLAPGVDVILPNPRTSSNGKLASLAAWIAIIARGGNEAEAKAYVQSLYRHVPVMAEGARGAATSFAIEGIGDVHLTWENEALREVAESQGRLQIVYPPISILAEPCVAWVDSAVARDGTDEAARAYLTFLFSDTAQTAIARFGYRPYKSDAARDSGVSFPEMRLVPITAIARDWSDAAERFFAENGVIDTILGNRPQ
jgi:sulfate/thiosulfate transport system substrate-binding protein